MKLKLLKIICLALAFLLFGLQAAIADFEISKWKYSKQIVHQKAGSVKEGYGRVEIDEQVFDKAKPDLSDLRVTEAKNKETAYKILILAEQQKKTSFSPKMFNLSNSKDSTVFYLDLGEAKILSNEIFIDISDTNFRRKVKIEGSDDLNNWFVLREDAYVFDFTEHDYSARNTTLSFNDSSYRYLRATILDAGEKPLSIKKAKVSYLSPEKTKRSKLPCRVKGTRQNRTRKATEIYLDLDFKNLPSDSIQLISANSNYNRNVEIAGPNTFPSKNWIVLGSDHIFSYDTIRFKGAKPELSYPEGQYRYLRLTIFNYDDEPLRIDKVTVFGVHRELVFKLSKGKSYCLYYGNAKAERPTYDIENLFPYLEENHFINLKLEGQKTNPLFKKEVVLKPWTERYPILLWSTLIGLVLVLSGLIISLMRKSSS